MNKRDLTGPVLIIGLSFVFIVVSFGVFLSRGKSSFWISKKMRIGSLLLSLTAITNQSCDLIGTNCYDPAPPNYFEIDNTDYSNVIEVDVKVNNKLTGLLHDRNGVDFSFNLTDTLNTDTVQVGEIKVIDGMFDSSTEEIVIELDTNLQTNTYVLNLYQDKSSNQTYPTTSYSIVLKNED